MITRLLSWAWFGGAFVIIGGALPIQAVLWVVTAPFDRLHMVPGRFLRFCGALLTRIYPPWRIRIEGALPPGPFVMTPNHASWLDVPALCRLGREMKWVTKRELFAVPWLGWMFRLSADIPVLRGDADSGGKAMARARQVLARGVPVVFFPEGTRSRDGVLRPFKLGAFLTAEAAGVPVVPVAISGTTQGMPRDRLAVRPSEVVIRVLPPVRGEAAEVRQTVRAQIEAALARPSDAIA